MRYVLFVCNHNAGRSRMAQAFFTALAPDDVRAESAGSTPAAEVWPQVVEAMGERGFDLAERRPKKLTVEGLRTPEQIRAFAGAILATTPAQEAGWIAR